MGEEEEEATLLYYYKRLPLCVHKFFARAQRRSSFWLHFFASSRGHSHTRGKSLIPKNPGHNKSLRNIYTRSANARASPPEDMAKKSFCLCLMRIKSVLFWRSIRNAKKKRWHRYLSPLSRYRTSLFCVCLLRQN